MVFPGVCAAQLPPESPVFPELEPEEVLKQACNTLRSKQSFTVDVDITYDNVLDSGEKVQYSAFQQLWMRRPNQLKTEYIGDERNTSFYYDGKTFTLLARKLNLYATKPAPPTLDEAIANFEEKYNVSIPLSNLLVSDPCKNIIPKIQKSTYLGFNLANGGPAYHFLFTGKDIDFQIWISDDAEPIPQKVVLTFKNLPSEPQYVAVLSNWNFNPEIPDDTFQFKPPSGAGAIDFLMEVSK